MAFNLDKIDISGLIMKYVIDSCCCDKTYRTKGMFSGDGAGLRKKVIDCKQTLHIFTDIKTSPKT